MLSEYINDAIGDHVFRETLQAGIRGSIRPFSVFTSVLPPHRMARDDGQGQRMGIVPDADLRVQICEARTGRVADPARRYHGAATARGPRQAADTRQLWDCKTIHIGTPCYLSARAADDGQSGAVAERAAQVDVCYRRRAAVLDAYPDVQAFNQGSTTAVSSRLRGFGPVRALVWGAYGEASDDVHQLLEVVVEAEAERSWRALGARSSSEARSYLTTRTVRSWGINAVREMARHRLRRVEFVGARSLPRAAHALGRAGRGQPLLGDESGLARHRAAAQHGRGAGMRP